MHNSARMLFSRFHFLVYGERKLRAWNRIRDVALCTLRSQHLCCRSFVKISLWAFESLGTKGPDLLIADNQCTVIAANYTTIVSSEKFNDIRIWYKYDMEIDHFDCGDSFGMALKTKSTDAKFSWNCLDDHWPWWNRGLITFCTTFSQVFKGTGPQECWNGLSTNSTGKACVQSFQRSIYEPIKSHQM